MTRCIIVSKISLPNTSYISNFYDALVRLTNTTLFNSTNGALDSSGYGGQAAAARGGGTSVSSHFLNFALLMNTTLFNSTNAALDYIGYAYNNANQRTEKWRGAAATNTAVSTNYADYTYDPIGQLTSDLAAELIGSTNRMNVKGVTHTWFVSA